MSTMLDTLLADTRRLESASRKNDGPIKSVLRVINPVTRADKIIAAGNLVRIKYRATHPTAETLMVCGEQIGHLHGEVRVLCDELDAMSNPTAAPAGEPWEHIDVRPGGDLGAALRGAMVRCFYDRDRDLMAVFLHGVELTLVLSDEVLAALEIAMSDELDVCAEENAINAAIDRGAK